MFLTVEDLCNHVNRTGECGCSSKSSTYAQSLSEMDFERGIWQAALNGDVSRVRKFLDKGTDPNWRDGLGYTALVNHVLNCRSIPSFNIPPTPISGQPMSIQLSSVCRDGLILAMMIIFGRWFMTNPNPWPLYRDSCSVPESVIWMELSQYLLLITYPLQLHLPNLIVK